LSGLATAGIARGFVAPVHVCERHRRCGEVGAGSHRQPPSPGTSHPPSLLFGWAAAGAIPSLSTSRSGARPRRLNHCEAAFSTKKANTREKAPRLAPRGPFRSDRSDYLGVPASLDGSPTGPLLFEGGKLGEPFGPVSDDRVEPVPMPVVPCMAVPRAGEPLPTCCEPFELPLRSVIPP